MPDLSPIALANAWPSVMPMSSTVWCASMCRSPLASMSRSTMPWRATWSSMCSRNGMPVASFATPLPSRFSRTRICVSLVLRSTSAVSHFNASRNAASSIRFSSGVPTVSRRQFSISGWPPEKSFTSTPCAFSRSNTRVPAPLRAGNPHQQEIRRRRIHRQSAAGAPVRARRRSRSSSTLAACASSTFLFCSSLIATASVSTLMLNGERVLLKASIHSGRPAT